MFLLGAGLNKILEENKEPPTFFELILTPDIYLPISWNNNSSVNWYIFKKIFFKNNWCLDPELNWKLILTMDLLYHLTIGLFINNIA